MQMQQLHSVSEEWCTELSDNICITWWHLTSTAAGCNATSVTFVSITTTLVHCVQMAKNIVFSPVWLPLTKSPLWFWYVVIATVSAIIITVDTEWSKKSDTPVLILRYLPKMCTDFCHFFTVRTRNLWSIRLPPHPYFVTALPSKTYTTANADATFSNV